MGDLPAPNASASIPPLPPYGTGKQEAHTIVHANHVHLRELCDRPESRSEYVTLHSLACFAGGDPSSDILVVFKPSLHPSAPSKLWRFTVPYNFQFNQLDHLGIILHFIKLSLLSVVRIPLLCSLLDSPLFSPLRSPRFSRSSPPCCPRFSPSSRPPSPLFSLSSLPRPPRLSLSSPPRSPRFSLYTTHVFLPTPLLVCHARSSVAGTIRTVGAVVVAMASGLSEFSVMCSCCSRVGSLVVPSTMPMKYTLQERCRRCRLYSPSRCC